jgi:hypothetical protein
MFVIDATGPISGNRMFEGFRFSNAFEWITFGLFDQSVDAAEYFFIGFLPKQIVIPGVVRENELQSIRSFSVPWPFSSWATDSIKRLAFFGDRKRYAVSSRASKSSRDIMTTEFEDLRVTMTGAWSLQTLSIVFARFCLAAV